MRRTIPPLAVVPLLLIALLATTTSATTGNPGSPAHSKDVFYTTSGGGLGLPNGAEVFAIEVTGSQGHHQAYWDHIWRRLPFIGAVASGDVVQHVRPPFRGLAAGNDRPEYRTGGSVRRACSRARGHGHGLRRRWNPVCGWGLQP